MWTVGGHSHPLRGTEASTSACGAWSRGVDARGLPTTFSGISFFHVTDYASRALTPSDRA